MPTESRPEKPPKGLKRDPRRGVKLRKVRKIREALASQLAALDPDSDGAFLLEQAFLPDEDDLESPISGDP